MPAARDRDRSNASSTPEKEPGRKRKAHTKSRGGCGNCKMRRVKCDEAKPSCRRCKSFGVSCTYDRVSSALQPYAEAAFLVDMPPATPSANQAVLGMLNDSLKRQDAKNRAFQLSGHDLELLNRFHERTSLTVGDDQGKYLFQREGLRLAFEYPFLLHIVITMTMMHDRSVLSLSSQEKQSERELAHWYHGTAQFNAALDKAHTGTRGGPGQALTGPERDAIWVTAALLGCTALAHVDGTAPEEVWPLKTPSQSDLDWLRISEGKREIWRVADIARPDSCLRGMVTNSAAMDNFMIRTSDREAFGKLPRELVEMCGLGEGEEEGNPYWRQCAILGRLEAVEISQKTILKFMTFLSQMTAGYRSKLEQKDARAMLILLLFYTKACQFRAWWWWKRATLEGRAMCIYLETSHADLPGLEKVLEGPRRMFMEEWGRRTGRDPNGLYRRLMTPGESPGLASLSETEGGSTTSGTLA